jgi:hypothetical protein
MGAVLVIVNLVRWSVVDHKPPLNILRAHLLVRASTERVQRYALLPS